MRRISDVFDGMKPFVICACVLLFFGGLAILVELQSASFVQWDGIKVHGVTYEGITSYTYKGVNYSIDNRAVSANDTRHLPTTVWLPRDNPGDSDQAFIESAWDRWTDFVFLTSWFFGAFVFLAIGLIRQLRRRRRREVAALADNFGTGLDPEIVQRILAERRRPPRVIDVEEA